jgi:hypothetical protein
MDKQPLGRLADLMTEWIETDPLVFGSGYAAKKKSLSTHMLAFAGDVANLPKPSAETVVYRGYDLKSKQKRPDGTLLIEPRACDLLESWTTDASWAFEHAEQFENGIVIRKSLSSLDVFLDVDELEKALGEDLGCEGEILVRPAALAVSRSDWTWSEADFPDTTTKAPAPGYR